MTQTLTTLRTASTAIAAVLALSSTHVLAQDAAPVIVLPDDSAVPAAPAPVVAAEPASVATPVVQAVPTPAAPVAAPEAAPATAAAPARAAAAPAPRPVAVRTAVAPAAAPVEPAFVPAPAPAPLTAAAPVEAAPAPVAVDEPVAVADNDPSLTGPLLGGAAVLGLGLLGFAAMRRRKSGPTTDRVAVIEKPRVVPAADPAMAAVAAVPHRTITPAQPIRSDYAFDRAPAMRASGGSVPLPRTAPQSYEERTALLRRMVEARPDRANPFTSRKARAHRARLILQSLDHDFDDRDPLFDASDYPQNWPLVARRKYAAAA